MLRFARETRLSETSFVQSPRATGADYRNRICTIASEIPFAGHPSLGTAVAVARGAGRARGARTCRRPAPGCSRSTCDSTASERWPRCSRSRPSSAPSSMPPRAGAVGLEPGDADPELPPQLVSTGLADPDRAGRRAGALASAQPDFDLIAALDGMPATATSTSSTARTEGERACPHVHRDGGGRRGPRHRLGGRTAVRVSRRARVRHAIEIIAGRRDGPAEPSCAREMEDDGVRSAATSCTSSKGR